MKLPSDEILKLIRYEEVANGQRWLVGGSVAVAVVR